MSLVTKSLILSQVNMSLILSDNVFSIIYVILCHKSKCLQSLKVLITSLYVFNHLDIMS